MRVFSYIVVHDNGFAPNPFHGVCSLACCKPGIRAAAEVGDLVVGLARGGGSVVYAMQIDRVVTFAEYWSLPEFLSRRPGQRGVAQVGDSIYEPIADGFRQAPSVHSNPDGSEHAGNKQRDLRSRRVLLAKRFSYMGRNAVALPSPLSFLKIGRGHRCRFSASQIRDVLAWFGGLPEGLLGTPAMWAESAEDQGGCESHRA